MNNYPPGAAYDARAPWLERGLPETIELEVTFTACKKLWFTGYEDVRKHPERYLKNDVNLAVKNALARAGCELLEITEVENV